MRNRYLSRSLVLSLLGLSLFCGVNKSAIAAESVSTSIVMLPPQDMAGNVCSFDGQTYGVLQWDGKNPIRCVPSFFGLDNGNVGIGTYNPVSKLQVAEGNSSIYMHPDDPHRNTGLFIANGHNGGFAVPYYGYSSYLDFITGGTTRRIWSFNGPASPGLGFFGGGSFGTISDADIFISSAAATLGNVGIGTTTPTRKLDVNGSIRMNMQGIGGYLYGVSAGSAGWPGKELVLTLADGFGTDDDGIFRP